MTEQEPLIPLNPGERLRLEREARGLTRAEVACQIRCDEEMIAALEDGVPGRLAPVYQRGFAQKYAQLLEFDGVHTRQLLSGIQAGTSDLRPVFDKPPPVQASDRWLRVSTYALASLLVGTLAWQITHEAVRLSQSDSGTRTAGAEPATGEMPPARAHVNASIASLESLGDYGTARPGAAGNQAWAALDRARDAGTAPLRQDEHLLDLSTSADSWVEIRDRDGNLLEQDLVRGGSSRQYRGFGPYRITLGRTSAVELRLDGEPVTLVPGSRDDVTQMTLDPGALAPAPEPAGNG